jgi:hypothetical protein
MAMRADLFLCQLRPGCSKVVATYRYFRFGGAPDEDAQNSQLARGAFIGALVLRDLAWRLS